MTKTERQLVAEQLLRAIAKLKRQLRAMGIVG
jgi:hypothetical protein